MRQKLLFSNLICASFAGAVSFSASAFTLQAPRIVTGEKTTHLLITVDGLAEGEAVSARVAKGLWVDRTNPADTVINVSRHGTTATVDVVAPDTADGVFAPVLEIQVGATQLQKSYNVPVTPRATNGTSPIAPEPVSAAKVVEASLVAPTPVAAQAPATTTRQTAGKIDKPTVKTAVTSAAVINQYEAIISQLREAVNSQQDLIGDRQEKLNSAETERTNALAALQQQRVQNQKTLDALVALRDEYDRASLFLHLMVVAAAIVVVMLLVILVMVFWPRRKRSKKSTVNLIHPSYRQEPPLSLSKPASSTA